MFLETDNNWQYYNSIIFTYCEIKSCDVVHSFHVKIMKWRALKKTLGNCSFVLDLRNGALFSLFLLALQVILSG